MVILIAQANPVGCDALVTAGLYHHFGGVVGPERAGVAV